MGRSASNGLSHNGNRGWRGRMFSGFARWSKFLNQRALVVSPATV